MGLPIRWGSQARVWGGGRWARASNVYCVARHCCLRARPAARPTFPVRQVLLFGRRPAGGAQEGVLDQPVLGGGPAGKEGGREGGGRGRGGKGKSRVTTVGRHHRRAHVGNKRTSEKHTDARKKTPAPVDRMRAIPPPQRTERASMRLDRQRWACVEGSSRLNHRGEASRTCKRHTHTHHQACVSKATRMRVDPRERGRRHAGARNHNPAPFPPAFPGTHTCTRAHL